MSKHISLIVILIALAFSVLGCQSTNKTVLLEEERERAIAAIELLGSDMLSSLEVEIHPLALEVALPTSYTLYSEYVPLYSMYKEEYLTMVASIAKDLLPNLYDGIYKKIEELALTPDSFVLEDTSLTIALRESLRTTLIAELSTLLSLEKESLAKAFEESAKEFNAIREAYMKLYAVNGRRVLPRAEMVDVNKVAAVAVDSLFDALSQSERFYKNRIIDRNTDSLYSIFWEVR